MLRGEEEEPEREFGAAVLSKFHHVPFFDVVQCRRNEVA